MTDQNRDRDMRQPEGSDEQGRQEERRIDWPPTGGTSQQGGQGSTYDQGQGGQVWRGTDDDDVDEAKPTRDEQGTGTPR